MEYTKFNSALLQKMGELDSNSKTIVKEVMDAYEDQLLVEFACNLLRYLIRNNYSKELTVNIALSVCKVKSGKHRLFTHMITAHDFNVEKGNISPNAEALDEVGEIMIACENSYELDFKLALISEKINKILNDYIYEPKEENTNVIYRVFSSNNTEDEEYEEEKSKIMKSMKEKELEYIQGYKKYNSNNIISINDFKNKQEHELKTNCEH